MTSTALDFLDSAKRLLDQPNPAEIACRNAVSRAYYAVYHHALSHADTQDWACYEMPAHQGLAERYAANQHKVSIQDDVGNIFGSLTDAAKFHGVTVEAIRYRIKTKKYKII